MDLQRVSIQSRLTGKYREGFAFFRANLTKFRELLRNAKSPTQEPMKLRQNFLRSFTAKQGQKLIERNCRIVASGKCIVNLSGTCLPLNFICTNYILPLYSGLFGTN